MRNICCGNQGTGKVVVTREADNLRLALVTAVSSAILLGLAAGICLWRGGIPSLTHRALCYSGFGAAAGSLISGIAATALGIKMCCSLKANSPQATGAANTEKGGGAEQSQQAATVSSTAQRRARHVSARTRASAPQLAEQHDMDTNQTPGSAHKAGAAKGSSPTLMRARFQEGGSVLLNFEAPPIVRTAEGGEIGQIHPAPKGLADLPINEGDTNPNTRSEATNRKEDRRISYHPSGHGRRHTVRVSLGHQSSGQGAKAGEKKKGAERLSKVETTSPNGLGILSKKLIQARLPGLPSVAEEPRQTATAPSDPIPRNDSRAGSLTPTRSLSPDREKTPIPLTPPPPPIDESLGDVGTTAAPSSPLPAPPSHLVRGPLPPAAQERAEQMFEAINATNDGWIQFPPFQGLSHVQRILVQLRQQQEDVAHEDVAQNTRYETHIDQAGFIRTADQEAKKSQASDFWKRVWDEKSSLIVMLAGSRPNGENDQYWPNSGEKLSTSSDLTVTLKSEISHNEGLPTAYTLRTFNLIGAGKEEREVRQIHIPLLEGQEPIRVETFSALIDAVYLNQLELDRKPQAQFGKMVLHCRNGAGLTGLFCAGIMLKQAREEGKGIGNIISLFQYDTKQKGDLIKQPFLCGLLDQYGAKLSE